MLSFFEKHFTKQQQQRTPSPTKRALRRSSSARQRSDDDLSAKQSQDTMVPIMGDLPSSRSKAASSSTLSSTDDDYETELANKSQRDAQLGWMFAFVAGSVFASWALGATGVSVAWLLLLLALLAAVWRASLRRLVEGAIRYETLRVARRRALSVDETAEWFNFLLNRWWVFSSPSLYALIREHLEPLLNEVKPSMVERLELHQFTLGDQTPHVRSVRAFDVSGGGVRRPLSPASLARPPPGLALKLNHQVALEADVRLDCDDFRMILRSRFGKGVGMDLDLAMEKLNISGRIYITFTLNMDAPFPHVTHFSLSFLERPEVWFSVRILKAVQMMEVPLLKTWIHSVVMEALVTSLVDPGHLDVNLVAADRPSAAHGPGDTVAKGVLTITLTMGTGPASNPAKEAASGDDAKWLVLCLGDQRIVTSHLGPRWQHTGSFLVPSLHTDTLLVKLKTKRFVSAITLAQFELPLASYNLDSAKVVETLLHKKLTKISSGSIPNICMRLEYTPLPSINLETSEIPPSLSDRGLSGVLLVCVHSADGLAVIGEPASCNPYCMVFNGRKKVKTTHYVKATGNPQWESKAQFLVNDFTQAMLSFVVCSWGRDKTGDTDLLGITTFSLTQEEPFVLRRVLQLNVNSPPRTASPVGTITVSVIFQPVSSVAQSIGSHTGGSTAAANSPGGSDDDDSSVSSSRSKRSSNNWMQQAKQLLSHKEVEMNDISSLLAKGTGLMEVYLIRAKDLEAKDLNGFSDPYCEVKINGECKYKSNIKKKTLNPIWEESAIMGLPRQGETLDLVIWDHDVLGMKDFIGSVSITVDEIRHLSSLDTAQWRQLQGVKTGAIEIRVKVISETTGFASPLSTNQSLSSSAETPKNLTPRNSVDSTDRGKLKLALDSKPPVPMRTVTVNYKPNRSGANHHHHVIEPPKVPLVPTISTNGSGSYSSYSNEPPAHTSVVVSGCERSPNGLKASNGRGSLTPSPEPGSKKSFVDQYSSFRTMKNKVKRGLNLRRFRSEVNMPGSDEANGVSQVTLNIEPRGGGEADASDLLNDLKAEVQCDSIPAEKFYGIEGKVVQAHGLHVAHIAQVYCRIKLHSSEKSHRSGGKTLAKSRLIPAIPDPLFNLAFEIETPEGVSKQAALLFEIRATGKELVASRRVTIEELMQDASIDGSVVKTSLNLSTGASIEVEVSYGREIKKESRKLFRSWSVHRIGKI
ncbi:uncharacterized protein LOC132195473 isoform X2 [Neocloeon triangulifer]|uniref:uncharacterized protein LOC132195473 isoform X2 n=1 Tax=Neocloeon triangulifer TaxID=2078957 RepID=UPI00286ECF1A|nr:uncharacterized protein LOC132195473 isoform X2 [Neocloeon triangulifer]